MKRVITLFTVVTGLLFFAGTAKAQSSYDDRDYNDNDSRNYNNGQQQQRGYDYYPDDNVYYDRSCGRYTYNNGRSWLTVSILPPGIFLGGRPHYSVFSSGPEIWRFNDYHRQRYWRQPSYNRYDRRDNRRDDRWDRRRGHGRGW